MSWGSIKEVVIYLQEDQFYLKLDFKCQIYQLTLRIFKIADKKKGVFINHALLDLYQLTFNFGDQF